MNLRRITGVLALGLSVSLAACGGEDATAEPRSEAAPTAAPEVTETAAAAVPATGNVVNVKMVTDDKGNYFEPADFTVNQGDVIRFELVSGVHNASFPAADNAGATRLPEATPYLQIAGQTHDVPVNMAPGSYKYVCDPHAALGMVGTVTVTP